MWNVFGLISLHIFEKQLLRNGFLKRICMRQLLHNAFAIGYTQYTIQSFYCQIGNNISLLLNSVNLGVLEA